MRPIFPSYLYLFFLLSSAISFAQSGAPKMKYGKVSEEEMSMKSYSADPSAFGVVLFDHGTVSHRYYDNQGFILEFEHHKRIKIFQKEAYPLADLAIFYFKGQKISNLKACAYNLENGKIVETKLSDSNVFDEKLSSDYFVKKAAIPAVREGTVIEFKYSIVDEDGLPLNRWIFQHPMVPTVWSEFESSIPSFIEYKKFFQGWTPFSVSEDDSKEERVNITYIGRDESTKATVNTSQNVQVVYTANTMHYIQENLPGLKPEPFVSSAADYISQISFDIKAVYNTQLSPYGTSYRLTNAGARSYNRSWIAIGNRLLEDYFEDVLDNSKFTGAEAAKCTAGLSNPNDKTLAIYEYIGRNYQATEQDWLWKTQTLDHLVSNKKGTPTELNLVLINMLRRAKVDAFPVLISTRSHGKVLSYRVSAQEFDRVITAVPKDDSTYILLDASAWPCPLGVLPAEAMNGEGLLLREKNQIDWIPLSGKPFNRSAVQAEMSLQSDGAIRGKINFSESGHEAVNARKMISAKDAQSYVRSYFKDLVAGGQWSDLSMEGAQEWNTMGIKGSFSLETPAFANVSGNKIYLNPMLSFGLKENPFKNPDRKFGVDFEPASSQTYICTYTLPEGYKVEEAPSSAKINFQENGLSFDYLVDKSFPQQIKITLRFNIRTPFVSSESYPDLQQFYSLMAAKIAEPVVLSK